MIDKFLDRTLAYNAQMAEAANRHHFTLLDLQQFNVAELAETCLSNLGIAVP